MQGGVFNSLFEFLGALNTLRMSCSRSLGRSSAMMLLFWNNNVVVQQKFSETNGRFVFSNGYYRGFWWFRANKMSLAAITFWRKKRPFMETDSPSRSALQVCGFQPSEIYDAAVRKFGELLLVVGRARPTDKRPLGAYGACQGSRHQGWRFQGLESVLDATSPEEFYERALRVKFPLDGIRPTFQVDLQEAINKICELKSDTPEWRMRRMLTFKRTSDSLRPLSAEMNATRPDHVAWAVGDGAHPALVCALIDAMKWPDFRMAKELFMTGFKVTGWGTDTGLWRLRSPADIRKIAGEMTPPGRFKAENAARHRLVIRSIRQRFEREKGNPEYMKDCTAAFEASMKEVAAGTSKGPFSISHVEELWGYGKVRIIRRHVVWQGDKARAVDDARSNGTNAASASPEIVSLMPPDLPAAIGQEFFRRSQEERWDFSFHLGGGVDDEVAAYRSAPVSQPEYTPVAQIDPRSGEVVAFIVRGSNFGIKPAVPGYNRKPAFVVAVARRLLACPVDHFFDDFTHVEPCFSRGPPSLKEVPDAGKAYPASSQSGLWLVAKQLGMLFSPEKSQPWSEVVASCGVVSDFCGTHIDGEVLARVKPSSRAKLISVLLAAKSVDSFPPSLAGSVSSKLRWVTMGPVGRAATQPMRARQYATEPDGEDLKWAISSCLPLSTAIDFTLKLLSGENLPDVVFKGIVSAMPPVMVWSDASWHPVSDSPNGAGRVAFIVYIPGPGRLVFAESLVPASVLIRITALRRQQNLICPLEEIALAAPYFCPEIAGDLVGRDVLHFADNMAANGAAIKGYSAAPDLALIVSSMQLRIARRRIRLWIQFVPSKLNLADAPSRGDFRHLLGLKAERVSFVFPSFDSWSD